MAQKLKIMQGRNHISIISVDVAAGMGHLSSQGVIHRDLAARNVLLDSSLRAKVAGKSIRYLTVKILDFPSC